MASVYTLAQIIAGEAQSGNDADSFGVASTIFNRAQSNYGGYGTSAVGQAIAPSQFSAYPNALGTPTPYQLQLAQAAQDGTLGQYGNTGNALFYNAPNTNAAYAAGVGNNYGPGSNQYSNVYNATPNSSLVMPQANASGVANAGGGDYVSMNPSDPNYGDITGYQVQGVNAPLDGSSSLGNDQGTPNLGGGITQSGIGSTGQTGTPLPGQQNTGEASVAGQAVQMGLGTAGTDVENASGGITGTLASAINSLETYTSTAFVVIALVVLGVIFVAYGLGLFGKRTLAEAMA